MTSDAELGPIVAASVADELTSVADGLRESVVLVQARRGGAGSGVVWPGGLVITNAHVVRGRRARIETRGGAEFEAVVERSDAWRDLAALRVKGARLPTAEIGDAAALRPGDLVFALGNPWGSGGAVTAGIVHRSAAAVGPPSAGASNWLAADLHLRPGNSGGPMADIRGRVVGINSMIARGMALAVPSNDVDVFLERVMPNKRRARLGVALVPAQTGALVVGVSDDSRAQRAGIMFGDVIVAVGGEPIRAAEQVAGVVAAGGGVRLRIARLGADLDVDIAAA